MSNRVKIGRINVNLDALSSASRADVDQMYPRYEESWRDELWSHLERLKPSQEEAPKKKKKSKKAAE